MDLCVFLNTSGATGQCGEIGPGELIIEIVKGHDQDFAGQDLIFQLA